MQHTTHFNATATLGWILCLTGIFLLIKYVWGRRRLYYYAFKMDGPFAVPFLGVGYKFLGGQAEFYKALNTLLQSYPRVFQIWIGGDLYFASSRVEDVEVALGSFLEKTDLYAYADDCFKNGLIYTPVSVWKGRRKMINQSFNLKLLNSFQGIFAKEATTLVKDLEVVRGDDRSDFIPKLWKCTLLIFFETLVNVDSGRVRGVEEYMRNISRFEKLVITHAVNPLYHSNTLWSLSPLGKESKDLAAKSWKFIRQLLELKRNDWSGTDEEHDDGDDPDRKRFMHLLLDAKHLNEEDVLAELHNMIIAATETTAVTLGAAMFLLSINPDIQDKTVAELHSIFGNDDRKATLEDINQMEYLERVLKETLRFFPVLPILLRYIDKDIVTDSYVIPAGSNFLIPIAHMQRLPELWDDPMKFDPDRFLPGELEKKHRCAYVPFSYGARNCIGPVYAMLSMKNLLSAILRRYIVRPGPYKRLEDVELVYCILGKPKIGWKFLLEERTKES